VVKGGPAARTGLLLEVTFLPDLCGTAYAKRER
jgi:hypothetical protein